MLLLLGASGYVGQCFEEYLKRGGYNGYLWRLRIPFDHRDSSRNYLSKLVRCQQMLNVRNSLSHLGDFVAAASLRRWEWEQAS